jgi:GNAT superfamily N-acetyltransferase
MATVADATPDRWDDLTAVMSTRGDPSRCWCQWFRLRRKDFDGTRVADRRAMLQEQVGAPVPPGVLAYDDDGVPSGWCAVAPRASYPALATSRVAAVTADADGLWAVTCFVVRVGARRQGLSAVLLEGAVDLARRHGAKLLEAYPIDTGVRTPSTAELYHGALPVFLRAGFTAVDARSSPARPVVRLTL